jgi:hypothetical protein
VLLYLGCDLVDVIHAPTVNPRSDTRA